MSGLGPIPGGSPSPVPAASPGDRQRCDIRAGQAERKSGRCCEPGERSCRSLSRRPAGHDRRESRRDRRSSGRCAVPRPVNIQMTILADARWELHPAHGAAKSYINGGRALPVGRPIEMRHAGPEIRIIAAFEFRGLKDRVDGR